MVKTKVGILGHELVHFEPESIRRERGRKVKEEEKNKWKQKRKGYLRLEIEKH